MLLLANIACLLAYLFVSYQFEFHSDSAAANLLAQEIVETGQYFPRDWNYVNRDLWVVFLHTWIIALSPFFDNGYALHAAGAAVGSVLVGLATWGMGTILGMSLRARLLALALFAAGFSTFMSEHVYGQQAYGTIYYGACAVLYCGWRFLHARRGAHWGWAALVALLALLVAWANPQRAVVYYLLPLFAGLAALCLAFPGAAVPTRRAAALFAAAVLGTLAGAVLYRDTIASNLSLGGSTAVNWLDFSGMAANVLRALHGMLGLLAELPAAGAPLANGDSVYAALRLVAAATVLALLPYALRRALRAAHPGQVFFAAAATASAAASLFVYIVSTVSLAAAPESSARYLVPGLMWALLVLVAIVVDAPGTGAARRGAGLAALAVLALSAPVAYDLTALSARTAAGGIEGANPNLRLARFLEREGLRYGYSTFWPAGQTTVLSKGAVKLRQVQFEHGLPIPMRHLSSNRWYAPGAWKGPSFLLLSREEAAAVDLPKLFDLAGQPVRRLAFEGWQVIVFDHNIAADFPSWRIRIAEPEQYRVDAHTPHAIGRFVPDRRALVAHPGEQGALRFGPYQRLVPGRYLVSFDLEVEATAGGNYGYVDVTAGGHNGPVATRRIERPGRQRIVVPIVFDAFTSDIEFRVFSSGAATVSLYNVELANDKRH